MSIFENVVSAFQNVRGNKMRSILTMLGIIIGISSVIMILSLGTGVKQTIFSTVESVNKTMIQVYAWNITSWEDQLSLEDMEGIKKLDNVENVAALSEAYSQRLKLRAEGDYKNGEIAGIDENYRIVETVNLKYGRFISSNDVYNQSQVAVITEKTAMEVFGYSNCVGEKIEIQSYNGTNFFTVAGVLKAEADALGIANFPTTRSLALIPITVLQEMTYSGDKIDFMAAMIKDKDKSVQTAKNITDFLNVKHNRTEGYYAEGMTEQLSQISTMLNVITGFVAFVAFISLFVGGVGVMNIMLVTVTERTREIGIRKSLGATGGDIKALFVMEALILTSFGGIVGIVLGNLGSSAIGAVITNMIGVLVSPSVSPVYVAVAFGVSSLVGIVFGVYPASKAAKLDPIEALRYE